MKYPRGEPATTVSGSTASAEEQARQKYRRNRPFLCIGQVLMLAGVVVGTVQLLTHIEAERAKRAGTVRDDG